MSFFSSRFAFLEKSCHGRQETGGGGSSHPSRMSFQPEFQTVCVGAVVEVSVGATISSHRFPEIEWPVRIL
jgi:hypothetical protein